LLRSRRVAASRHRQYVTACKKLLVFDIAQDRVFVFASAGNLATTQELLNCLRRGLAVGDDRETLLTVRYMFEAANYVGRVSRLVQAQHA